MKHLLRIVNGIVFILLVSSCSSEWVPDKISVNIPDVERDLSFADMCENLAIIPLENNRDCMLSNVRKMCISNEGYYIYNEGASSEVLKFNLDGSFNRRIGKLGRSQSEYAFVNDFALDTTSNKVAILMQNLVKLYTTKGEYLETVKLESNDRIQKIETTPRGFIGCSSHVGSPFNLYVFNKDFKLQNKLLESDGMITSVLSYEPNPVQVYNDKICYFDFHESIFYVFSLNDVSSVSQYQLNSDNILTKEKVVDANYYESSYDCVVSSRYTGSKIVGIMNYDKSICYFVFDLINNKFHVFSCLDWPVTISSYYNGYYYASVSSEVVADIINNESRYPTQLVKKVRNALNQLEHNPSALDNYMIIRFKIKEI